MIDFIQQHWAAITVAAAWLVRELRNLNGWLFDTAEYFQAHGGLFRWLGRVFWNGGSK